MITDISQPCCQAIRLPPLRERREDIPALVRHFVLKLSTRMGKRIETIPKAVMDALAAYSWPGNIRELQNVIERGVILSQSGCLQLGDWLPSPNSAPPATWVQTMEEMERRHILDTLELTGWRVSGEHGAAKILGRRPTTLESRMQRLGIQRRSLDGRKGGSPGVAL